MAGDNKHKWIEIRDSKEQKNNTSWIHCISSVGQTHGEGASMNAHYNPPGGGGGGDRRLERL